MHMTTMEVWRIVLDIEKEMKGRETHSMPALENEGERYLLAYLDIYR